jgi:hypothetical protein
VSGGDLDARLRRHFAGTDTEPGFEARVMARVSALPVLPVDQLRLLYERRDFEERARLLRTAWLNVATAFGVGVAAIVLVWREGPAVARWMDVVLAASRDTGGALTVVAFLAAGIGVWAALGRTAGRL